MILDMRLSQSGSVVKTRKDQKFRNRFKVKKKHKKLDAICESSYTRSHKGVENVELSEPNSGGNELELRRSNRARKAPVLLDSSPMPPKKRQKVDRGATNSAEKVRREDVVQCETRCSSSWELDEQNDGWRPRLRSRGHSAGFSRGKREESLVKGKRKLFEDYDGSRDDDMDPQFYGKKDSLSVEKLTVVKSKRPERIKASNVLANENKDIDLGGGVEGGKENNGDEVLEVIDEVTGLHLEINIKCGNAVGLEEGHVASELAERDERAVSTDSCAVGVEDGHVDPLSAERGETGVEKDLRTEEYHTNGNVEIRDEYVVQENLPCDIFPDQVNLAEVDCAPADQGNVAETNCAPADQAKDKGNPDDEQGNISKEKYTASAVSTVVDRKSRIKLGRRCGLCGGGVDGKPPKILLEGAGSDNEAYSGSSGSEEPNYDVLDGFGDQPGWLGRLLGPINDRFGIAGIWVHQHCAVWSPEVYFAGLGCLKNVRAALYRGRVLKCSRCRRPGATIGCRVDRCSKTYHLPCARAKGCIFDHRKFLIACTDHRRLFQPYGIQSAQWLKKMKAKKLKLELRKMANDACRKDIEAEEKWLENCGEDEEFLKRESKRLHRDLLRISPTYIGGANSEREKQFQGWESVAGLQDVIRCMKEVVILPLLYPEFFTNIGLTPPRGVLLHGYPGTGKTLVVRALVGSCARGDRKIAYFARKGADCLGKYVGDAERQLRLLFQVAEKSQPSIIFFDEIDGLAPCRTKQQDQTHNSVVSTLLALMDGIKSRGSVIVIGATNRPDAVDPALRRPGRFDREIYFPLPSVTDREAILSVHTQKWPKPVTGSLLKWIAQKTGGFAGADLQALCTQAAIIALRRSFPLQEVLSAAESQGTDNKCPAIPTFTVEERDWLEAVSCAPPPCSRRESGVALNDVVSSPLKVHLVPYLLVPLTKLLVGLYLDERVWLPLPLKKDSKLVKEIIVSTLRSRSVHSDNWWLHVDTLLQEADVTDEIEKNIVLDNILVGKYNPCEPNVREENTDKGCSNIISSKSQYMGTRPGLLQNISHGLCSESGFQVLMYGDPRSGQSHLASCLLHYFVGSVDVWKIDLAGISHEGRGDMIHGLTYILMKCAGSSLCLLYMPMIDLWAIDETSEINSEVDIENGLCSSTDDVKETGFQPAAKKASYIWTSFIEQVESMRVNTPLIILATSELPLSSLPSKISQFFGNEILNRSLSSPSDHKVPRFSIQLDGIFNHDKAVKYFAANLTKDLVLHFVQSLQGRNHNNEKSVKKTYDLAEGAGDRSFHIKPNKVSSSTPVNISNKTIKGKSSLSLAISTFGYQILCYPHFAELCWVTSKLKEGPCANTSGPWKGWPFNSCIVRPEKAGAPSGSGNNTQTREPSGFVRGLVAVGLSAYRGEYYSLKEVCYEVRKVLETLVGRIDGKIQAGKDRSIFTRILSQVAYLEDMIISWAHALHSLEVDTRVSDVGKDSISEGDGCKLKVLVEEEKGPSDTEEAAAGAATDHGTELGSIEFPIGFATESNSNIQADGPFGSGKEHAIATCFYECCSECYSNLHNLLLRMINTGWGLREGNDATLEDFHDFVASLSATLHLSVSKLFGGGKELSEREVGGEYRKSCTSECRNSDKVLMVECNCHEKTKDTTKTEKPDSRFVFKDGVLASFDTVETSTGDVDDDRIVSCHCKFEELCLCYLIEWLGRSNESVN